MKPVRNIIKNTAWDILVFAVRDAVRGAVGDAVRDAVGDAVKESL